MFEIKVACITDDTAKTSIKNHIYHYTIPHETVICDSDGTTGNCISHQWEQYYFLF
jgi:hypothetical protein